MSKRCKRCSVHDVLMTSLVVTCKLLYQNPRVEKREGRCSNGPEDRVTHKIFAEVDIDTLPLLLNSTVTKF